MKAEEVNTKLKPCPFCGGGVFFDSYPTKKGFDASVECPNCLVIMLSGTFDTKMKAEKQVIKYWNRRTKNNDG